jgi:peptidyl-tRNA hydrolase, PTH1 family
MILVGLGNPGNKYRETRHNAGFFVVEHLCTKLDAITIELNNRYFLARARSRGSVLFLMMPLMYMNRSGIPVAEVLGKYEIPTGELLVVYDDFQLPLGRIRIRKRGSDGGHNGMSSVIGVLNTEEIARIRLGIFTESAFGRYATPADFVLSDFDPEEIPAVDSMIERAGNAVETIIADGIERAMNIYNQTPE